MASFVNTIVIEQNEQIRTNTSSATKKYRPDRILHAFLVIFPRNTKTIYTFDACCVRTHDNLPSEHGENNEFTEQLRRTNLEKFSGRKLWTTTCSLVRHSFGSDQLPNPNPTDTLHIGPCGKSIHRQLRPGPANTAEQPICAFDDTNPVHRRNANTLKKYP